MHMHCNPLRHSLHRREEHHTTIIDEQTTHRTLITWHPQRRKERRTHVGWCVGTNSILLTQTHDMNCLPHGFIWPEHPAQFSPIESSHKMWFRGSSWTIVPHQEMWMIASNRRPETVTSTRMRGSIDRLQPAYKQNIISLSRFVYYILNILCWLISHYAISRLTKMQSDPHFNRFSGLISKDNIYRQCAHMDSTSTRGWLFV